MILPHYRRVPDDTLFFSISNINKSSFCFSLNGNCGILQCFRSHQLTAQSDVFLSNLFKDASLYILDRLILQQFLELLGTERDSTCSTWWSKTTLKLKRNSDGFQVPSQHCVRRKSERKTFSTATHIHFYCFGCTESAC